jgi:hypothetical protein
MLRRGVLAVWIFAAGCTPIRGLDPIEDSGVRMDGAILDADRPDAPALDAPAADAPGDAAADARSDAARSDANVDAGCTALDLCNGADEDCDATSADGSEDPMMGMPCDGPDTDLCTEGVYTGCALGVLTCGDASDDSLEACGAGDEDCDGMVDEGGATGTMAYYPDADFDGYGDDAGVMILCAPPGGGLRWVSRGGDCDDTNNAVRPGRGENCDGLDQNCDGSIDEGTSCDAGCVRHEYGGHAYQVCSNARSQTIAASRCMGFGYHLVQIEDSLENDFVHSLIGTGFPAIADAWIGLEASVALPPTYTWPDGSTPTYTAWDAAMGEPNMTGTCVRMRPSGLWADWMCATNYAYICEAP